MLAGYFITLIQCNYNILYLFLAYQALSSRVRGLIERKQKYDIQTINLLLSGIILITPFSTLNLLKINIIPTNWLEIFRNIKH